MSWRKSTGNPRIWILERGPVQIGSIEPKGKRWMNRDTGEVFDAKSEAMRDVERYA